MPAHGFKHAFSYRRANVHTFRHICLKRPVGDEIGLVRLQEKHVYSI